MSSGTAPTPLLDQSSRPAECETDFRTVHARTGLDVHDDRPVISQQHVVRHVRAVPTLDGRAEEEWLCDDSADLAIEVGEQEPGELEARFVDDMTLLGRRPIGAGTKFLRIRESLLSHKEQPHCVPERDIAGDITFQTRLIVQSRPTI